MHKYEEFQVQAYMLFHSHSSPPSNPKYRVSNLSSNESSSLWRILLVVQVSSSDSRPAFADVVAGMADSQSFRGGDASERLASLWIAKDHN
jgi:hypothetical protein